MEAAGEKKGRKMQTISASGSTGRTLGKKIDDAGGLAELDLVVAQPCHKIAGNSHRITPQTCVANVAAAVRPARELEKETRY
jgi:hypothetical protein